jgi:phosphohistidine swiveling domain-containing protein
MTAPLVLAFPDVPADALVHVGGKGANLAWMARAGLPVPPGFCVTTAAFSAFIGDAEAHYDALDALAPDDVEGVRRVAAEIRAALVRLPVPEDVATAVLDAWRTLDGPGHTWAVRSSATAEDLPDASFAGQQDTFLNVRGAGPLLEVVRDCWVSLFTDRAVLYRARNGFPHRLVKLAVVVQRMVRPEVSGILFTADPVSGSRALCSIDAGWGLGEALVGGLVNADLYIVDKVSGAVREARVGDKAIAIRPRPDGGTFTEELPAELRTARVLTDTQCAELAAMGRRIEAMAGELPQDIEWCYEAGVLHVVQARPITSLFPLPEPCPKHGLHAYVSFGHAQMMPEAMPPLARDTWVAVLPFGRGSLTGKPAGRAPATRAFVEAGGRLYIDVTTPLRIPRARRLLLGVLGAAYPEIPTLLAPLAPRLAPDIRPSIWRALPVLRLLGPLLLRVAAMLAFRSPKRAPALMEAAIARLLAGWRGPTPTPRVVRDRLAVLFSRMPRVAPPLMAGAVAQRLLVRLGVAESALEPLLRALPGNVTTEMDLALADLADLARPSPGLIEALERDGLAGAEAHPDGRAFVAGFRAFVERYGMRGAGEIDLSRPRWRDDPALLLKVITGNLRGAGEPGAHRRRHAEMATEAEAAMGRIAASTPAWKRPVVRRLLRLMRAGLGLREHPKAALVRVLDVARASALAAGQRLVTAGVLDAAEDVWFLRWDELVAADETRADLRATVAARREAHARDRKRTPPLVMTSEGEVPRAAARADLPAGALGGLGASAGVVEGRARVVLDPGEEVLHAGEILVAPFTDPGWTPLFTHAAGLVAEVGGMMTHGSVVAREMGIPAVVGVAGATGRIRTGDRLRVDGARGSVEILGGAP